MNIVSSTIRELLINAEAYATKKRVKDIRSNLQEILDEYNLKAPLYKRIVKLKIRETEFEKNTTKKIKRF